MGMSPTVGASSEKSVVDGGKPTDRYLWHDYDRIFLYGGLFSDVEPLGQPTAFVLWQYDIASGKWSEAQTSVAENSGSGKIERAAEGAGVSVPGRLLGFYFGGHLDVWTTEGWSLQTARVYLKSLLEFDMEKMQFRNVTESGLEKAGVPERADGVLVFVSPLHWPELSVGTDGRTVGSLGRRGYSPCHWWRHERHFLANEHYRCLRSRHEEVVEASYRRTEPEIPRQPLRCGSIGPRRLLSQRLLLWWTKPGALYGAASI